MFCGLFSIIWLCCYPNKDVEDVWEHRILELWTRRLCKYQTHIFIRDLCVRPRYQCVGGLNTDLWSSVTKRMYTHQRQTILYRTCNIGWHSQNIFEDWTMFRTCPINEASWKSVTVHFVLVSDFLLITITQACDTIKDSGINRKARKNIRFMVARVTQSKPNAQ